MSCLGAKCILLVVLLACLFIPGRMQPPQWFEQLRNLNESLSDLQINANTTMAELVKQLNSTADWQKVLTALGGENADFSSYFSPTRLDNLRKCGDDLRRVMNNSDEMLQSDKLIACMLAACKLLAGNLFLLDIDAAGKSPTGVLRGHTYWPVNVDQCTVLPNSHMCGSALTIFSEELNLHIPVVRWSGCFPNSCTANNVTDIISAVMPKVLAKLSNGKVKSFVFGSGCKPEFDGYDTGAICSLVFCALLLLFCLVGTILDVINDQLVNSERTSFSNQNENIELQPVEANTQPDAFPTPSRLLSADAPKFLKSKPCEVCLCFSLIRNTRKIFSTDVPATAVTSINGVRVISMWWIVLGHVFLIALGATDSTLQNKYQLLTDSELLSVMPVLNAYFAVDTFFFLSGLLVAYTCFRKMEKSNGKFNWILFYVHRFWRLTPSYMFVILFRVHLKAILSDAPLWTTTYRDAPCSDKWWANLLYINNFYPTEFSKQCMPWSWYLANDMQFFIVSPILLILAFKYKWRGLIFSVGPMLLISTVVTAGISAGYDIDPLAQLKILRGPDKIGKKINEYEKYVYEKPYCRIQPYLIGFILGYAFYMKFRGPIKRRGWFISTIGWSVAFAVAMGLVYGPHETIVPGNQEWNKAENVLYGTFQHPLWGLVVAWVTYACHCGYGSYIQEFLSAKFWIPLSRLTYSVYLIHIVVMNFMFLATNGTMYYEMTTIAYYFIGSLVLSYAVGFILAVAIEFPAGNLESLVLKFVKERKKYTLDA